MIERTFEEAMAEGRRLLPEALRTIAERLESDDMVESTVLCQAADELEHDPWHPIETSPKDGKTAVDLWFPSHGRRADWRWYKKGGYWGSVPKNRFRAIESLVEDPTHWMYPPAPPEGPQS